MPKNPAFPDSVELTDFRGRQGGKALGALWAYGGWYEHLTGCTCDHLRRDMDGWARSWIPSPHLFSIMALDSNGNLIARIGRYGNVDDVDEKYGRIHMSWPRAATVSDEALYVMDNSNARIFRCKLGYEAEEELPLP